MSASYGKHPPALMAGTHRKTRTMITTTATLRCPACGRPSIYIRPLDRFLHSDGWCNDTCWSACSRGHVNELIANRNDRLLARRRTPTDDEGAA